MSLGAGNPVPFQVGGGPTDTETAYQQLRRAVGKGGSASDDTGIEGLWRWCEAKGAAAATSAERRALLQAVPELATDLIPSYERLYGIVPPTDSTEAERAKVAAERVYQSVIASTPDLFRALQGIDPRFSILEIARPHTGHTHLGRMFEAMDSNEEGPAYGTGRKHAIAPNWSTEQIVRVRFTLGYSGRPTPADERILIRARALLRRALPSEVDFTVSTGLWQVGITPIGLGEVA